MAKVSYIPARKVQKVCAHYPRGLTGKLKYAIIKQNNQKGLKNSLLKEVMMKEQLKKKFWEEITRNTDLIRTLRGLVEEGDKVEYEPRKDDENQKLRIAGEEAEEALECLAVIQGKESEKIYSEEIYSEKEALEVVGTLLIEINEFLKSSSRPEIEHIELIDKFRFDELFSIDQLLEELSEELSGKVTN